VIGVAAAGPDATASSRPARRSLPCRAARNACGEHAFDGPGAASRRPDGGVKGFTALVGWLRDTVIERPIRGAKHAAAST